MQTVMITGANRGLGLEFARQYGADGWSVIATCRNPAKAKDLNTIEGDVTIEAMDVDDTAAVGALAEKLTGARAIDVLINNAGVFGPRRMTPQSMDYEAWGQAMRVNVMSPLRVSAAFVPHVAESHLKTIIVISSTLGSIANNTGGGDYIYRSSKAAVNAVMKSLSIDLVDQGIKVLLLHPGWVKTDMGGPNASIEATESVQGMRAVIAGLKKSDSGRFFAYDGTPLPW